MVGAFLMLNKMSLPKKPINRKSTKENRSFIILRHEFKRKYCKCSSVC